MGEISRSELLKIFSDEVKLAEDFVREEMKKVAKITILNERIKFLKLKRREAKRSGDIEKTIKIGVELRKLRNKLEGRELDVKKSELLGRLQDLINEYKGRYEEMVYEGFGTTQKVTDDFLIGAIASIRKAIADVSACETESRKKETYGRTVGSFKYPWDWSGYNSKRYPRCIGLDPDKIKCENCKHWDKEERICLISGRRVQPSYKCSEFSRRGL